MQDCRGFNATESGPAEKDSFYRLRAALILLSTLLWISGCAAVGPDYVPQAPVVSGSWQTDLKGGLRVGPADPRTLANWWTTFGDPLLSELIARALKGDLGLKEARARVREARARRGISRAARFPAIDASGSATRTGSSEENGSGSESSLYAAGFDAGWELDLFGGTRRSIEAADAELQSAEADLGDVLVSLLAEVALNYVDARTFQTRMALTAADIKAQEESCRLIRMRYESGLSDDLALQQARHNLASTRSLMPELRTGFRKAAHRLAVLLGETPGAVLAPLDVPGPIPVAPSEVAVGVPADALRRRPDVYQAERQLAAQTAKVGVATAERYPKFTLSGSIGLEALSGGSLFSGSGRRYSIGPQITWAVFDAGAVRRNIAVQSALQEQKLCQYESVIRTALEEVENALVAFAGQQVTRLSLKEAVQSARQALYLSQINFRAGLADFSDVLEIRRSLLALEDRLAQSESAVSADLIGLYKALGGGWKSVAPVGTEKNRKEIAWER